MRWLLRADLGFHGADGRYATHGWHPFLAKCPPRLPRFMQVVLSSSIIAKSGGVSLARDFGEIAGVLREMWRVLRSGRATVVVVGTSMLRGIDIETPKELAAIGGSVGFRVVGIGVRRLDRDKRMMPARWGGKRQLQTEQRMHEENVIGLIRQ